MVKTMELLRKKDLHPEVGVPKSTVADWIEDFNVYIPKVKQGNVTYYRPESIDVLKFIKQCRDQNLQKPQIMELLAKKGFPITVEDAIEDVKKALEVDSSPRDTLLTVMQTMGQAVSKIAEQDERLSKQDERLTYIEKRTDEIEYLKSEFEKLKKELAATKEELATAQEQEKKKGFFSRLFSR